MLRILYLIFSLFPFWALGSGAWYKDWHEVPTPKAPGFDPEFVILKAGVFSQKGEIKPVIALPEWNTHWKTHCETHRETIGWFTHKLTKGASLSPEAGSSLAKNLNALIPATCFTSVELDIEPLVPFQAQAWLFPFLKSVREKLDPKVKLRMAIPAITADTIPGPHWDIADAVKIFRAIDGVDVMLYDTGLTSDKEYSEVFKNAFFFAMELVKEANDKTIILGLPAYSDKTKLHQIKAENLEAVAGMLQTFTPFQSVNFCLKKVRFAYYAGWSLTAKDKEQHKKLEDWKENACKKDN